MRRAVALAFVATVVGACSEPLEFADWTVPVPEGTRIIEYAAVSIEERTERIELLEDLVIGSQEGPNFSFYDPADLAVDRSGRVYVLDSGNHRVQVFDTSGGYVRTLGREGQGPGELAGASRIAVAGDRLVVWDSRNRRLSVWSLDGDHLGDQRLASGQRPNAMFGTNAGALITRHQKLQDDLSLLERFVRVSPEGEEVLQYVELPVTNRVAIRASANLGSPEVDQAVRRGMSVVPGRGSAVPVVAVDPQGPVYFTSSLEHHILAMDAAANTAWALRAQSVRAPFPESAVDQLVRGLAEVVPELNKSMFEWPETVPSIAMLSVDGHGHLYVFHYVYFPADSSIEARPVDVYSPEGDRLFAGTISDRAWAAVRGDFMYSIVDDPESEEQRVVRYRLVEPFD